MTSKELCENINSCLYVPISEDLADRLLEVITNLVADLDANDVDICSRAFFKRDVSPSYEKKFKTQYNITYGEDLELPAVAFEVLEICQVLLLLQSDEVNDDLKAKYSLIVRNNAIWRKSDWYGVLCPIWIEKMYSYYPEYYRSEVKFYLNFDSLLETIVINGTWNDTGLDIYAQNTYNRLRSLCAFVMKGRVSAFSDTTAFTSLSSPFAQVYLLVVKMVRDWKWKYIEASPVKIIISVMGKNAKKRKELGKITKDVKKELPITSIVAPVEKSSVLLARVSEDCNTEIDEQRFSVLEYGVYLYYELLLETYND